MGSADLHDPTGDHVYAEGEHTPSPFELWMQAREEHPLDAAAYRARYHELMREHGHIVDADHPDAGGRNLPCGWPGRD